MYSNISLISKNRFILHLKVIYTCQNMACNFESSNSELTNEIVWDIDEFDQQCEKSK